MFDPKRLRGAALLFAPALLHVFLTHLVFPASWGVSDPLPQAVIVLALVFAAAGTKVSLRWTALRRRLQEAAPAALAVGL